MNKRLFISKSYDELLREAKEDVLEAYFFFVRELEKTYGEIWVKDHPETIARLVQASFGNFDAASITEAIQGLADCVENASTDYVSRHPQKHN